MLNISYHKMARQLLLTHSSGGGGERFQVGFAGAGITLFLCAAALFMCASHSRKWRQWRACYEPDTDDVGHPVIHHHHIEHGKSAVVDVDDEEVSVWQKNILMGGKCQLPDFSGVIIYDSNGGLAPPPKTPRLLLPWK